MPLTDIIKKQNYKKHTLVSSGGLGNRGTVALASRLRAPLAGTWGPRQGDRSAGVPPARQFAENPKSKIRTMNQENRPLGSRENNDRLLEEIVWTLENSGGQFSLILVKCNYASLRSRMAEELRERYSGQIREIFLEPSDSKIYSIIREELGEEKPEVLMVFGLESVRDIDRLLVAMNSVREEFRKHCRFPLVLWVNDAIARKLIRLAPDFESWMTRTEFAIAPEDLAALLREKAALFFNNIMTVGAKHQEPELSVGELETLDASPLQPIQQANLYALLGFAKESDDRLDAAIADYQRSLALWQEMGDLERQAKILSHLTECCYRQAKVKTEENSESDRQLIRNYLQQCLGALAEANRSDLAIDYLGKLGKILCYLQDWQQLETLALQALERHRSGNQTLEVARDYGFLAEVALARQDWPEAKRLAESSLSAIETISPGDGETIGSDRNRPNQILLSGRSIGSDRNWQTPTSLSANASPLRVRCLFVMAEAEKGLGEVKAAIANLEKAKAIGNPDEDLELYLQIFRDLQYLYFEDKQYLEAYQVKQERRSLEQQYGLRAFVGAGYLRASKTGGKSAIGSEIAASGRDKDVERLLERLGRPDYKIIVIYGYSGVGKSSLLNAGLIPAIQQKIFETKEGLPVAIRVYTQWVRELGKQLSLALERKNIPVAATLDSQEAIREQLRQIQERNLLVVLICDQFEEFFFAQETKAQRNPLFEFLGECRKLDGVKVIFSLKKSYLYKLLGRPGMEDINNDILSKNILYKIGNLTSTDAQSIIEQLTKQAKFHLEPDLTQALVQDLAGKYEKVRPIELQVVGAQLQEDSITTLAEYRERGSKQALVQRYLDAVVADCGEENRQVAELTLFLLTDEKDSRPLKTQAELAGDLEALGAAVERLDLVLRILVASGLVFHLSEASGDRYQLAHDYLAELIRSQQEPKIKELIAELERERQERRKLEASIEEARQELEDAIAEKERIEVEIRAAKVRLSEAQIETRLEVMAATALQEFNLEGQLEGLLAAIRAGKELQEIVKDGRRLGDYPSTSPIYALQEIMHKIREKNRLEERWSSIVADKIRERHRGQNRVSSVSFSPDGEFIVTASEDGVRLWSRQGNLLQKLAIDGGTVWDVSFSPDRKSIATASEDGIARLWDLQGSLLQKLAGSRHKAHIPQLLAVSFSPNGKYVATTWADGTVGLWDLQGNFLQKLTDRRRSLKSISFSSDGKYIAIAESFIVEIRDLEGNLIKEFTRYRSSAREVSFSPDGKHIAIASTNGIVTLWDLQGNLLQEFNSSRRSVTSVCFSPDGKYIATASSDRTAVVWDLEGNLLQKLVGHSDPVTKVCFSPDGKYLATASSDGTARLWDWQENQTEELTDSNPASDGITVSVQFIQRKSLDELLARGCNWLRDYLQTNPNVRQSDRHICDDISPQGEG